MTSPASLSSRFAVLATGMLLVLLALLHVATDSPSAGLSAPALDHGPVASCPVSCDQRALAASDDDPLGTVVAIARPASQPIRPWAEATSSRTADRPSLIALSISRT